MTQLTFAKEGGYYVSDTIPGTGEVIKVQLKFKSIRKERKVIIGVTLDESVGWAKRFTDSTEDYDWLGHIVNVGTDEKVRIYLTEEPEEAFYA